MSKIVITDQDKKEFNNTEHGKRKALWMIIGMIIDFFSTLGVCLLHIFAYKLPKPIYFYGLLFILLVIVVLGGEMIGVYYGSLEQYVYNKKFKKRLLIED